jgi:hypothetical protein
MEDEAGGVLSGTGGRGSAAGGGAGELSGAADGGGGGLLRAAGGAGRADSGAAGGGVCVRSGAAEGGASDGRSAGGVRWRLRGTTARWARSYGSSGAGVGPPYPGAGGPTRVGPMPPRNSPVVLPPVRGLTPP